MALFGAVQNGILSEFRKKHAVYLREEKKRRNILVLPDTLYLSLSA